MISLIKRLRLTYCLYNLFHRNKLKHNIQLYKKYGLKKKYFSSISSKDFKTIGYNHLPFVKESADITTTEIFQISDEDSRKRMLSFQENGFLILRNYLSEEKVNLVNEAINKLLQDKAVKFKYGNKKIMFAFHHSTLIKSIGEDEKLKELLAKLVQGEVSLFQSINFLMGSEQHTHSDSIHMTTYPLGGLLGAWFALDDITDENGPLHYYPGSHKLPYYLNADYDNEGNALLIGSKSYEEYETMIAKKIAELGIKKEIFTAKKGDLLIWHANLFHGGETHKNKQLPRRSMVFHYFKKDAICYHEITQRPALLSLNNTAIKY
jgi:hypothetical protein